MRCSTVAQSILTAQMLVHMPLVDMQPLNMLITLIGSLEQKGILVRLGGDSFSQEEYTKYCFGLFTFLPKFLRLHANMHGCMHNQSNTLTMV